MATMTMPRPAPMTRPARRALTGLWLRMLRVPDEATLRSWDDAQVLALLERRGGHAPAYERIIGELDRRAADERRAASRKRRAAERRLALQTEFYTVIHALYLDAERECRGVLLNKAGVAAGIEPASILYGPWARARKYASWEMLHRWDLEAKRITFAEWKRQRREPVPE